MSNYKTMTVEHLGQEATEADLARLVEQAECVDSSDIEEVADLSAVWDIVTTPVFRVVDESGVNVADAQCRRLYKNSWLYVDDTDGWCVMLEQEVSRLYLVPEEHHIPLGWDQAGNVIRL